MFDPYRGGFELPNRVEKPDFDGFLQKLEAFENDLFLAVNISWKALLQKSFSFIVYSRKYTRLQIFYCPHDPKTPPKDRKPCIYIYECMPKIDHFQMLLVSKGIHRNQVFQHLKVDQTLF